MGVIPPPQDLTVANEERLFDDGGGAGWSPGGWVQESSAEDCVNMPDNPSYCPGQVFTFPGRPWCYDASPLHTWDPGTCKDRLDRATAAFKQKDYGAALAVFSELAEKDYAPAQANLCTIYAEGTGTPKDAQKAVHWCRKAAKEGDPKATYNLALMYSDGIGVPKDDKEAAHWYRKAAYYGYANAQYNLGVMYTHGIGVPQDDKQAAYWYRRAASQGNVQAQYNLGVLYSEGAGVPQDDKQALYWFCKGTIRGEEKAQTSVAKMYGTDGTLPEKDELAYFCWLFSADKRNNITAYADRHLYDRKLTPEQRERAIATATMWKRK
ncbi:TPR repeat protein [Paucimonas lemoignei]|uniref:TPR repeat protein n=1 Tax=Paucimonas lemoignei TaxID=29443 RepID=A0A4R3I0P8_PAULE|nr:TPR repeat protein [Paucimonas lemoignei]